MTGRRVSLRRRLDNLGLRIRARVDTEWSDRVIPFVAAGVLLLVLVAVASATIRQLDGGSGLGVWRQAAWMVRNGMTPETTLTGTNPVLDSGSFIAYPVMWLTELLPAAAVFTIVQAAALSLAVIPLWQLCRDEVGLRIGATLAVVVAYGLAPAVHAASLSAFRPEVLAVPALFSALLAARRQRWPIFVPAVAIVLLCRADLGLTVAALGILVASDGHGRIGLSTSAVGVAWSAVAVLVLDPRPLRGTLSAADIAGAHATAPLAELRTLFVDPTTVVADVFSSPSTGVVVALLAPLLFLPLVATRHLLPAVPAVVLGLATSQALARSAMPGAPTAGRPEEDVVVALPFIFFAAVIALGRIGRPTVTRVNVDHRLVAALLAGALLFFVDTAPSSPFERPWQWGSRDAVDTAREEAVEAVPDDSSITTSPQITELVAERASVGQLPYGPPPRASTRSYDVVVLDTTATTEDGLALWTDEDVESVLDHLGEQGFRLRYRGDGILALSRQGP